MYSELATAILAMYLNNHRDAGIEPDANVLMPVASTAQRLGLVRIECATPKQPGNN